jgi:hypothetical protein
MVKVFLRSRWEKIIVGIFLLGVILSLPWAYHKFKNFRVRRLDEQAFTYLRQGKVKEAEMSLHATLLLAPDDPLALRLQARLQQSRGQLSASLASYQRLASSGKMSLGDLRPYANLAARAGEMPLAKRLAESAAQQDAVLGHLIRADFLLQQKDPDAAAAELRNAFNESREQNSGKADSARMELVVLLMKRSGSVAPEDSVACRREAYKLLQELGGRQTELGASALAFGLEDGIVPEADRASWLQKLRAHPKVTSRMLLLADSVQIAANPPLKPLIVGAAVERLKAGSLEQRVEGARWLVRLGETRHAAELISKEEAMKEAAPFVLWMESQELSGRYEEVIPALDLPSNPLPPYLRSLYRADAFKKSGHGNIAKEAFAKALADYGTAPSARSDVLIFLEAAGEQELFEKGLAALLADPLTAEPTLRAVMPGVRKLRDSAKLLRADELAAGSLALGKNAVVANNLDYDRLVMNQELTPQEVAALAERVEANPNAFSFRVTQALQLLKSGDKSASLQVMESIPGNVEQGRLPAHEQAVLAMALLKSGRKEEAQRLLSMIHREQLTTQEEILLKSVLAEESHGSTPVGDSGKSRMNGDRKQ